DALAAFVLAVGVERRSIARKFGEVIRALRPLPIGELHARLLEKWRTDLRRFRERAVGFRVADADEPAAAALGWRGTRDEIHLEVPGLQRRGLHFIRDGETRAAQLAPDLAARTVAAAARLTSNDRATRDDLSDAEEALRKLHISVVRRGRYPQAERQSAL